MKIELTLTAVANDPYGTWIETPNDWPIEAWNVFNDELAEPFGRAEYWKKRSGVFFKDWGPCEFVEEAVGLLREAGIEAKVSAKVLDTTDFSFCRRMTVAHDSNGIDLVEIEPVVDGELDGELGADVQIINSKEN